MENMLRTMAQALRSLRKRSVFALASISTLALGIGTAATFGGVLNRVFLQPPAHVQKPEEVISFLESRGGFSYPAYLGISEASRAIGPCAAYQVDTFVARTGSIEREMRVAMVSPNYFSFLGTPLKIGRYFTPSDSGQSTAVISYALWQEAFGGSPEALGQQAEIARRRYTIIGVAAKGFRGISLRSLSLWVPLTDAPGQYGDADHTYSRGTHWLNLLVRLQSRIPLEDVKRLIAGVLAAHEDRQEVSVHAYRMTDSGPARTGEVELFFLLTTLSGVVLLACCANVSGLVLMQLRERSREAAIRAALGAGRMNLLSPFLAEIFLISLGGGAGGSVLAFWMANAFRNHILPADFSPWELLDVRMGVLILGLVLFSGILAGGFSVFQTGKPDLSRLINNDSGVARGRKSRVHRVLASAQIALAFVLLVHANLLLRSLNRWRALDFGFDYEHTLVAEVDYKSAGYSLPDIMFLNEQITKQFRKLPDVRHAGYSFQNALRSGSLIGHIKFPDGRLPGSVDGKHVSYGPRDGPILKYVSTGYLATLGIKMLAGREFNESDLASNEPPLILSKKMASFLWPGEKIENVLGRCLKLGAATEQCSYVVGVAQDVLTGSALGGAYAEHTYYVLPTRKEEKLLVRVSNKLAYFVDTGGDLGETTRRVRNAISQVVPGFSDAYVKVESTQVAVLGRHIAPWESAAVGTAYFGVLTFLLALVGLSSNLTQFTLLRRREIAIRMTFGASRSRILLSTVWRGLSASLVGGGTGAVVAVLTSGFLKRFHFGVDAADAPTVAVVAGMIVLLTSVACIVPAYRITRMQPAEILRE